MMKFALITLSVFCAYFFIGYMWLCWISYRNGAGFWVPNDFTFQSPLEHKGLHILLWPIYFTIYICCRIEYTWKTPKLLQRFTPRAYYEKGRIDNYADYQAEKHLLR